MPLAIPSNYVESSPGVWCHPSRLRGPMATGVTEPDSRAALVREAPAPEAGGPGVEQRHPRKRPSRDRRLAVSTPAPPRVRVHLAVRLAPGHLFDGHDNLRSSLKPLVDAIAETLGVADADSRVEWEYSQAESRGEPGVIVTLETVPGHWTT